MIAARMPAALMTSSPEGLRDRPAHQAHTDVLRADQFLREVDGQRIGADPDEGDRPLAELPDVDDEIEQAHQHAAVAPRHNDVRGRPEAFDDGQLESPQIPEDNHGYAAPDEITDLLLVVVGLVAQKHARKHAQEAACDGRDGAE